MSLRSLFASAFTRKPPVQASVHVPEHVPPGSSVHTTTGCARHGHPEFQVRVSRPAVPADDIAWLLQFFETRVAQGETFRSGESLQVGWMFTMLQEESPGGMLRVLEPDMQAVPVRFVDAADATLLHLRTQQDIVRSLSSPQGLEPDFPSLRQSVVVHLDYRQARRILLTRSAPVDALDSGWWLTDLDDEAGAQDPTRFSKTSLYQLAVDRPDLVKFFAVPVGLQVFVDGARIGVLGPESEVPQIPGSYLDQLNALRASHAAASG